MPFRSQLPEFIRDDAEVFDAGVFDGDIALRHGCQPDEGSHFDHIGQHAEIRFRQGLYAIDDQHVAADAADLCAHVGEHPAKLLYIRVHRRRCKS